MSNLKAATDSFLLESFISGDQKSFAELVRRYQSRIYSAAMLVVRDKYLAEDILQDTFCKFIVVVQDGKYKHQDKLSGYLVRIAHNLAVDRMRKSNLSPTITLPDGKDIFQVLNFSEESTFDKSEKEELKEKLKWAISQLPDDQREILLLRYFAKMSFKEISEITNLNINTALGRVRYAVKSLRKYLIPKQLKYDPNLYPR